MDGVVPPRTPKATETNWKGSPYRKPGPKKIIIRTRTCLPHLKEAGPFDVICARGKEALDHPGNKWLRQLARRHLKRYANAPAKGEKSNIMSSIIACVRAASVHGGFIKRDKKTGLWWEVGDLAAREKVGLIFRDALCGQYKSNNRYKYLKRKGIELDQAAEAANLRALHQVPSESHLVVGPLHTLGYGVLAPNDDDDSSSGSNKHFAVRNSKKSSVDDLLFGDAPPHHDKRKSWSSCSPGTGSAAVSLDHLIAMQKLPATTTRASLTRSLVPGGMIDPGQMVPGRYYYPHSYCNHEFPSFPMLHHIPTVATPAAMNERNHLWAAAAQDNDVEQWTHQQEYDLLTMALMEKNLATMQQQRHPQVMVATPPLPTLVSPRQPLLLGWPVALTAAAPLTMAAAVDYYGNSSSRQQQQLADLNAYYHQLEQVAQQQQQQLQALRTANHLLRQQQQQQQEPHNDNADAFLAMAGAPPPGQITDGAPASNAEAGEHNDKGELSSSDDIAEHESVGTEESLSTARPNEALSSSHDHHQQQHEQARQQRQLQLRRRHFESALAAALDDVLGSADPDALRDFSERQLHHYAAAAGGNSSMARGNSSKRC